MTPPRPWETRNGDRSTGGNPDGGGPAGTGPVLRELLDTGIVHFMGVGGAGMCALAEAVARQGARVTGCDLAPGPGVAPLERLGIPVRVGHDPAHLEGVAALVVSAAIPADHPEVKHARAAGIPVWKRAQALGEWVNPGRVVAVAGTHGKTTTSAMLTEILDGAGMEPTGFVGGWVPAWQGHLKPGRNELFVVEADEYDRSFHHLRPSVAVVTNVEADHLDVYGDLEGVRSAFATFLQGVAPEGTVLACADDPGASALLAGIPSRGRSFGFAPGSQLRGVELDLSRSPTGFRVLEDGKDRGLLELGMPGLHNATNALAAAATARVLGVGWGAIRKGLADFAGVGRRFQVLDRIGGVHVVDDYAHHPTELAAALAAARQAFPGSRIVAVFQPHLFSRTRDFAQEFGRVLASADVVWVTEVYPARERPIPGIDGALVVREVEAAVRLGDGAAAEVRMHASLDGLVEALAGTLRRGDVCLTLGAGSIEKVGPELVRRLGVPNRESPDA